MLDRYIIGTTNRISPEGPIPVLDVKKEVKMLGGVGNVVRNLSTLAIESHLVSLLGNDINSKEVEKKLDQIRVNKNIVKDSDRPTITKTRFIANNQQILRVDKEKILPINKNTEKKIYKRSKKEILNADAIIISDYNKGLVTDYILKKIISFSKKNKKPIIIDPKSPDFKKYKGATIVTPNIKELEEAVKKKIVKLDAEAKEVFDVSGAGDTVVSFIAAGLASSLKLEEVVKIANIAAGIVVNKTGTSVAHLSEMLHYANKNSYHLSKVMDFSEVEKVTNFWKKKK